MRLVEALAERAREEGIRHFTALVFAENELILGSRSLGSAPQRGRPETDRDPGEGKDDRQVAP
jgi:L-amino acid N-acyltransferase YncA